MRDGTILRADVFRPDHGGPYPVLVQRTPYGKRGGWGRFAKAGYIFVNQDSRGRYESEGKFESYWRPTTHEAEDGYDTVEWAAKLPGSTGKVGTFGKSYPAYLQWRLAPLRPPSLVAMSACSIPAQIWYVEGPHTIRPAFRLEWLAMMAVDMRRREDLPGVQTAKEHQKRWWKRGEGQKWINWLPWLTLPDDFFGYETDALKSWLRNPPVDPWRLDEGCKDIAVPNLDIVGWYDHCNGDMLLFRTMVKEAKTEVARKGSRIIIGPWGHGRAGRRFGNIDFGPDAPLDEGGVPLKIRWFDYWLKGISNGIDKEAPVKIFVMGDNRWRDEQSWPLKRTKEKTLFIASQGNANTPSGDGRLIDGRPELPAVDTYVYDPRDPVPTPYGARRSIPADQRPLANRQDILVYQTEPIIERIEVTGNPVVELYAASSAPDTDWFVRLIDVAPDGLARDASSGMVRARYRDGFDKSKPIPPGEVVKYTIRMGPTSNAFLPGHRIRLDITSSDFPNYDRNHNTAANQNADATLAIANQTIYHGGEQATRIILPWVPNPIVEESPAEEGGGGL
jgi:putative CocE/NonD family hydrolase